ncbi:MAG TPA: ORF6N domain-containing protein [Bacteroidales bacterium]|nr:ORF6N domain-containing protein [Bacteroidales bacterium]HQI45285.1 ORF6N domain-containing protein [Bacteroidales bacterium]
MIKLEQVENKIITINNLKVIIDSDVAILYGVETKRINEAVKNNPDKFPEGYILAISQDEWDSLRSKISHLKKKGKLSSKEPVENFDRFENLKHSTVIPKAFTEKGLYMLATILKSPKATQTTLAIIETFTKMRELSRTVGELSNVKDEKKQKILMQKSGNLIAEILDDDLQTSETETTIELNFAILKFKHTVKRK